MKKSYFLVWIAVIAGYTVGLVVVNRVSTRELGNARLEGTPLTVRVIQGRSLLAGVGVGQSRFSIALIDPAGIWIQTQEIPSFQQVTEWGRWEAPASLSLEGKDGLRTLPIVLNFPSGQVIKRDVVVGVVPQNLPEK